MHPDHLVVVMGDLNTGPDSPAVAALLECGLVDTHRAAGGDEFAKNSRQPGCSDASSRTRPYFSIFL